MPDIRVELGTDPDVVTAERSWDFEDDLGGWRTDGPVSPGGTVALTNTHTHTGNWAMRLTQDPIGGAASQPLPCSPGRRYRLTAWLRPDTVGTTIVAMLWMRPDGTLARSELVTPVLDAGVWSMVTVDDVAHPSATAMIATIVYSTGDPADRLYIDDVTWAQVTPGWVDVTDDVPPQTIAISRGRGDEAAQAQPMSVRVRLDNSSGHYTPGNALSPYYGQLVQGLPLRVSVDHDGVWHVRMEGRVDEWAPTWPYGDLSRGEYLGESVVDVVASGPLRRLGQGDPDVQSALTRRVSSYGVGSYWPLEDPAGSAHGASPNPGVAPISVRGEIEWAERDDLAGSAPLPVLTASTRLVATPAAAAAGQWRVSLLLWFPAAPAATTTLLDVTTTGSLRWRVAVTATPTLDIQAWDGDGVLVVDEPITVDPNTTGLGFMGAWVYLYLEVVATSSGLAWTLRWDNPGNTSQIWWGLDDTVASHSAGMVTQVAIPAQPGLAGASVGHVEVTPLADSPIAAVLTNFDQDGRTAAFVIARLLGEVDVAGRIVGDEDESAEISGLPVDSVLPLLVRAAEVDGGILSEMRDVYGIEYRTRSSLYNQEPALVLDGRADDDTAGLQNPFTPVLDDQRLRNHITVKRDGGSSATVADEASIAVSGRYTDDVTVAAHADDQLAAIAGWRLHMGTWPGMRYPSASVDLAVAPGLIDDWLNMDLGDLIRVENLPPQHPAGSVDLLMEGYTEALTPTRWDVTVNASPGGPWTVGVLPAPEVITEGFEDSTLDITITPGGDLPWARDDSEAHTGSWSLRSGPITGGQMSDAVITVPSGATEVSLWYRVSSEAGFDELRILVDASTEVTASGEVDWTQVVLDVAAASTVTLQYAKDGSVDEGSDSAWVDDVVFTLADSVGGTPNQPDRADTAGSELASGVDATEATLSVATTQGPVWADSSSYPDDFPFDVRVGGEVVRVTAISGTTSPQDFTVTRSVNGISKSHDTGTAVSLAHPAIVAL